MLIEWNKLNFRQRDNNLSHVYAMFSVEWDRNTDKPSGRVSYEGAASLSKLNSDCQTTKILRKGQTIPGTKATLQADNYGIHFKDLYKHLNHLVAYLLEHEPPVSLTEDFRNPYSGETTASIQASAKARERVRIAKPEDKPTEKDSTSNIISSWIKKLFQRRS